MQREFPFQGIPDGIIVGQECGIYALRISRDGISRIAARAAEAYIPAVCMVEIYRTVAGDVYQPVGIEILEIGLVLALVGGLAYGVAGTCRAKACSHVRIPCVAGGCSSGETADAPDDHLLSERRMAEVPVLVQSVIQFSVCTFPDLVWHAVSVDVNEGNASFVVRLGIGVGTSCIDRCRSPAGSDHDSAAHGVSPGRAAAEKRHALVKVSDVVADKSAAVVLLCRIDFGGIGEDTLRNVVVVAEALCRHAPVPAVFLHDAVKKGLGEGAFPVMERIGTQLFPVIHHFHAFEQGIVCLQYAQAPVSDGILASGCCICEPDAVGTFLIPVSRIAVDVGVEVVPFLDIPVGYGVAVGVLSSAERPAQDVSSGIFQHGTFIHHAVPATEEGYRSVLGGYFPGIVLRGITPADDPGETALGERAEMPVLRSCRCIGRAVGAAVESAAHEQVALAFLFPVKAWHAPSGLDVNALQGKIPAVAGIGGTAVATVLQADTGLHAGSSGWQFKRILQ